MKYQIFVRTWWKKENGKLTPHKGRKTILGYESDYEKAREMCKQYNGTHNPGELSRKAEFTSNY